MTIWPMSKDSLMKSASAMALAALVSVPATALAQDAEAPEVLETGTITVFGSVPTRNRIDTVAPALVYDQEFFSRFQPLSVGDALKRVPGVSFSSDVGEFDEARLRGLGAGFTQILINGRPVTSAGGEDGIDRVTFVDRIPAELVERIEIIRSPSADVSSEGVGGTINIILRDGASLPEGGFVRAGGLYYHPNIENADAEFGALGSVGYFGRAMEDRLSYAVTGNVQQRRNRKFQVQESFTSDRGSLSQARDLLAFESVDSVIGEDEERQVQQDSRDNLDFSINANATYRFPEGHELQMRGYYINTDREEREDTLVFADSPVNLDAIEAQDTFFDQYNLGVDARYEHQLTNNVVLGFGAAYSFFDNETEQRDFESDLDSLAVLPTEDEFRETLTVEGFGLELDGVEVIATEDREVQLDGDISVRVPSLADRLGFADVTLKTGVQVRLRNRETTFEDFDFTSFEIDENRYDSFFLAQWDVDERLSVETGLRLEYTTGENTDLDEGGTVETDDFQVNPSVHIRYEVTDFATMRASYARTVRRPNLNDRVPFGLTGEPDDGDITAGNPDLEFETAHGFDVGFDFTIVGGGVMGVNFFYRDVSDLIQLVNTGIETEDDGEFGNLFRPENTGSADIYGLEFDLSTSLEFLGLPYTGLFANYTYLESKRDVPLAGLTDQSINGQPDFVYNVGLTQDFPDYGVTMGFSYQKQGEETQIFFDEIQGAEYDANLEAFVEKRFGEWLVVRLSGQNLLDAEVNQFERNFDGSVADGEIDNFEIEREEAQQVIQLSIRANF